MATRPAPPPRRSTRSAGQLPNIPSPVLGSTNSSPGGISIGSRGPPQRQAGPPPPAVFGPPPVPPTPAVVGPPPVPTNGGPPPVTKQPTPPPQTPVVANNQNPIPTPSRPYTISPTIQKKSKVSAISSSPYFPFIEVRIYFISFCVTF